MCDEGKKSQVYLAAVARLKQIFEITSPEFEPALLAVVRKHCQGEKAQTLKKGNRRCRQTYKNLSTRPMYKEVFGGIVKVFKIRDAPRFYKDVGDVLAAFCELPESKIMEIRLEKMRWSKAPDMNDRVYKIEIDPRYEDQTFNRGAHKYKFRKYKIKWMDLDPSDPREKDAADNDVMWCYKIYGKGELGPFFIGRQDYKVHKIMKIKLEKMGLLPDMKGRVFTIERDDRSHNVHVYQQEKIKLKMFKMKWHDLKPDEKFLEKFDKMWTYRERPRGYVEKLGQFFLGDIKDVQKEYGIDFF